MSRPVPPASPPSGRQPPARRRPPGRYDEPSRLAARGVAVLLSVLFVAFLAALGLLLYERYGTAQVPISVRGFEVVSDAAVRVDFTATPPEGERAWCLVRAREARGAEVGARFVPVERAGSGSGPVEVSHTLPTTARAVTGEVPRCTLGEPPAGTPTAPPAP